MIRALIDGERDAQKLAELAQRRLKAKIPQLKRAMRGHFTEHHRFMLNKLMGHLAFVEQEIAEFDARIESHVASPDLSPTDPPARSEPGDALSGDEKPADGRALPAPLTFIVAVEVLRQIAGIDLISAQALLAEIGADMSRFRTHKHLNSWARICPGINESAGKRKSAKTGKANRWLRRVLVQCAWAASRTKGTYFGAQYRQIAKRRGKKRAIIAVAHSLLTTIYHMLKYRTPYRDLGGDFFDKIDPARKTRYHVKRLEELGHQVILAPQPQAA